MNKKEKAFSVIVLLLLAVVFVWWSVWMRSILTPSEEEGWRIAPNRETSKWNESYSIGTRLKMRNRYEAEDFVDYRREAFDEKWVSKYTIYFPGMVNNYALRTR